MLDDIRVRAKIMGYITILVGIIISLVSVVFGVFGMLSFETGGNFGLIISISIPIILIGNLVTIVKIYNKTIICNYEQEEFSKKLIKELGMYFKVQAILIIVLIFVYFILPILLFS